MLIKNQKYDLAETTLLKNRQIIEPIADKSPWDKKLEWQLLRINIISSLIFVYQKLNKPHRIYQILKTFFLNMRIDLIFENPESFEREIEYLFISMAFCCFSFKRYDEAEIYANDGIKFIRKILRNDELLTQIQEYINEKKHNFDQFITKKNINLAKLMNLQGKISEKLFKRDDATSYYHQAYSLIKMVQGEENSLTVAFKIDLRRFKETSPAFKMKSNMSFPSISELVGSDTNKKESIINKLVSTKSIIASYNEIPDATRRTSNKTLKNSSFMISSLDKDSNLHSQRQRQKCVTLHESCHPEKKPDPIVSKRTPKKQKIRPVRM